VPLSRSPVPLSRLSVTLIAITSALIAIIRASADRRGAPSAGPRRPPRIAAVLSRPLRRRRRERRRRRPAAAVVVRRALGLRSERVRQAGGAFAAARGGRCSAVPWPGQCRTQRSLLAGPVPYPMQPAVGPVPYPTQPAGQASAVPNAGCGRASAIPSAGCWPPALAVVAVGLLSVSRPKHRRWAASQVPVAHVGHRPARRADPTLVPAGARVFICLCARVLVCLFV
jgi:hypothetical protein